MTYELIHLPYASDALAPVISKETIEFHHGKHLQTYVDNLNKLIAGTEFENMPIEEIIAKSEGGVFNNAGQVLNHNLYFTQFTPQEKAQEKPEGKLLSAIESTWGSFEKFKEEMTNAAITLFGSGWAWLAADKDGRLVITKEPNGSNPCKNGLKPILGFDVWEHSYYLTYQNKRADHIKDLWTIINWEEVAKRY
ncbi:superoxide dismutase [Porphyromonas crevioricanis]|uniref:superoxide dismutase n=1 Tax=Porphyromonas crevioricanis TaxID=393921 RepID=UPI00052E1956|nr:superoxide dismutase [Porphyromonas crevioricanis]KGN88915.1 superoxide dismutase [Porphyromonas crevioricanis]